MSSTTSRINSLLPIDLQLPKQPPSTATLEKCNVESYPEELDINYRVIVCSIKKTFEEAERFFLKQRLRQKWKHETPIFRTARFWCKRVSP